MPYADLTRPEPSADNTTATAMTVACRSERSSESLIRAPIWSVDSSASADGGSPLGLREAFAARATNCRRCRRMWGRQYSRPAPAIGGGA